MGKDVGRNDPCPCGSGKKYKKCCLRKRKKAGGSRYSAAPSPGEQLKQAYRQGMQTQYDDPAATMRRWVNGWRTFVERLPPKVTTFAQANERIGDARVDARRVVEKICGFWLQHSAEHRRPAREGIAFIDEVLARFPDTEREFCRALLADKVNLLSQAELFDEAEALGEALIEEHPTRALGYFALADAYLNANSPRPQDALDVLLRAQDAPVEDPGELDLSKRIQRATNEVLMQEARASDDFIEWNDFFTQMRRAPLDTKLTMAQERILHAPDFDREWAFSLLVEQLSTPCFKQDREDEWLELFDLLAEERPQELVEEAGPIGSTAINMALRASEEHLDDAMGLIFTYAHDYIDYAIDNTEQLAFYGVTRIRTHLMDQWATVHGSGGIMASGLVKWSTWAAFSQLAHWMEQDDPHTHTPAELFESLGEMMEYLSEDYFTKLVDGLYAPLPKPSSITPETINEHLPRLLAHFSRHLMEAHGWPALRALSASSSLMNFLHHTANLEDPFQDKYTTDAAAKSAKLRGQLKALREPWLKVRHIIPHPDLTVGSFLGIITGSFMESPHDALAFFSGAAYLTGWLYGRGFYDDAQLRDSIREHLLLRTNQVKDRLSFHFDQSPLLKHELSHTRAWLAQ